MMLLLLSAFGKIICVVLSLCVLRLLAFVVQCHIARRQYAKIKAPGPPQAKLFIGHVTSLAGGKGPWNVAAWANEYGPLFKTQLLGDITYVLSDPATVGRVTRKTGGGPYLVKPRRLYKPLEAAIKPAMPNIVTSEDSPYWKAVRQGAAPCFSNNNIKKVLPLVLERTLEVVARIAAAAAASPGGAVFDVSDGAKRITSDVMGQMLFGEDLGGTRWVPNKYLDVFYPVLMAQAALINNPWHLQQLWKSEIRQQRRSIALHNSIMDEKVRRVMQQPPPGYTIAAHLLTVKDPATGLPLTHHQLKAEIAMFMAAGFETTSHAITWTLTALAAHPEVQEKLHLELVALGLAPVPMSSSAGVAGAAGAAGAAAGGVRDIEAADLGRLPYMQAVIKEVLRLCPPAPWGGSKMVMDEHVELCGYSLPKGSLVMIPSLALSLSSRNYGPDTLCFRPDRWLSTSSGSHSSTDETLPPAPPAAAKPDVPAATAGEADTALQRDSGRNVIQVAGSIKSSTDMPQPPDPLTFMVGPRDCIGQSLAKLELQVVIATLLARFRLSPGEKLQHELQVAAATGQTPVAAIHALAAAYVTLQPADGQMLLKFHPRC